MIYLGAAVVAYLLGAIPTGLLLGWLVTGQDIRRQGSGKTGATNVIRAIGWWAGLLVLALDAAKGSAAVLLGRALIAGASPDAVALGDLVTAFAAIAGHNWPVYVGFRGGRGVATAGGTALVIAPGALALGLVVMVVTVLVTDIMSTGSLATTIVVFVLILARIAGGQLSLWYLPYGLACAGLIVGMHHDNIRRLLRGTERRLGVRAKLLRRSRPSDSRARGADAGETPGAEPVDRTGTPERACSTIPASTRARRNREEA